MISLIDSNVVIIVTDYGLLCCGFGLYQIQRGFRSVVVYLTVLDVTPDYIAVGSSIGMLYLYCRRLSTMNKYNLEVSY